MARRQLEWARKQRLQLRRLLGLRCWNCGSRDYRKLEFDCIFPQGDFHHRRMDWSWRMSFYRRQLAEGNLALLCQSCNSKKGDDYPFEYKAIPQRFLAANLLPF